jgi:hypothetical protein
VDSLSREQRALSVLVSLCPSFCYIFLSHPRQNPNYSCQCQNRPPPTTFFSERHTLVIQHEVFHFYACRFCSLCRCGTTGRTDIQPPDQIVRCLPIITLHEYLLTQAQQRSCYPKQQTSLLQEWQSGNLPWRRHKIHDLAIHRRRHSFHAPRRRHPSTRPLRLQGSP